MGLAFVEVVEVVACSLADGVLEVPLGVDELSDLGNGVGEFFFSMRRNKQVMG